MRLMLGRNNIPSLLVGVDEDCDLTNFKFYVVNGCWEGQYQHGLITVFGCPSGDYSSLDPVEILCDDQKRLGGKYQEVFENFCDPNYVSPVSESSAVIFLDDIPY